MKRIYKRQPVQHDLPPNYDDLDAINYNNISNFKGLQVYDNPLIADQASTYACKNVYVDEHGNLTVRPSLVPLNEDSTRSIVWSHTFNDGGVLQLKYLENQYILDTNFTDASMTFVSDDVPNVVPVDTGDNKYIFIQDVNIGSNVLYKIDNTFEQVEGTILLDNPLDTDIAHYNILNNKVKYEYAGKNLGSVRPEDEYNINYMVPFAIDWNKPHKIQLLDDKTIVIATQNRFIISSAMNFINLTVDTGYQRDSNDWCIRVLNGQIEITVACLDEDPATSDRIPNKDSVGSYFWRGRVKRFMLSLGGEILSEYTATIAGAGLFAGYGYAIILIGTGGTTDAYGNISYELYTRELNSDFDMDSVDDLKDWTEIELTVNLYPVIQYRYTAYRNKPGYYGRVVAFADGLAYIQRDYTASPQSHHVYYRKYDGAKIDDGVYVVNDEIAEYGDLYSIFDDTILSEANHLYLKGQDWLNNKVVIITKESDGRITVNDERPQIKGIAIALSSIAVYSLSGNSIFEQEYLSIKPVEYIFNESPIFATDLIAITSNGDSTLVHRSPKLLSAIIERDASVIPVLSEINEHVVIGFFLDNCWWFITEHSIFGTGVDANGLQTPERFDPLKYFKVSEVITGAIRISDTSFWVFHNNGAYLIYKTSLALANGTEYRWLCTATAKSKGCDFENALATLPVSSNIVTVTGEDICNVVMKENIQSDERTLVPMTTQFSIIIRELLQKTASVKILNHKYLTIFFLNPIEETGVTPAVVFDNVANSWWQWEFPIFKVYSVDDFRQEYTDKIEYTSRIRCKTANGIDQLYLSEDEHYYNVGLLNYEVYCDRLLSADATPTIDEIQIDWMWQSAMQLFNTLVRRKQLLFTTFVFDDYMPDENAEQYIELGYYFNIYSRQYATSKPDSTTASIYRVSNNPCRTMISNYNYLQLVLHSRKFEEDNFEVLTKPKICCISMKYRILRGEWT